MPTANIKVLYNSHSIESFRQYAIGLSKVQYVPVPSGFLSEKVMHLGMHKDMTVLWHLHPVFWKLKELYKWADIVVCAPGGICMGGFQDWDHLFYLELARFYRRPLAYYGRSFGPFPTETKENIVFKKKSLALLHYFAFLSIRDSKTEQLATELGLQFTSTVDTAFLDAPKVEVPYELKAAIGSKPYMVLVPNYLIWHYAYKGKITHEGIMEFYCRLIETILKTNPDYAIVMLPQLFCGSSYEASDVDFFREIACKQNTPRIIVAADCYSSDIQQTIIADAKYVIGARYHSIVFAINQGTPFISLGYEHKMIGLLESIKDTGHYVDISKTFDSEADTDATLKKIEVLIPLLKENTVDSQRVAKNMAERCMDTFVNFIQKNYERK